MPKPWRLDKSQHQSAVEVEQALRRCGRPSSGVLLKDEMSDDLLVAHTLARGQTGQIRASSNEVTITSNCWEHTKTSLNSGFGLSIYTLTRTEDGTGPQL